MNNFIIIILLMISIFIYSCSTNTQTAQHNNKDTAFNNNRDSVFKKFYSSLSEILLPVSLTNEKIDWESLKVANDSDQFKEKYIRGEYYNYDLVNNLIYTECINDKVLNFHETYYIGKIFINNDVSTIIYLKMNYHTKQVDYFLATIGKNYKINKLRIYSRWPNILYVYSHIEKDFTIQINYACITEGSDQSDIKKVPEGYCKIYHLSEKYKIHKTGEIILESKKIGKISLGKIKDGNLIYPL
jgi:hypothetical protein